MDVTLHIPDEFAERLKALGGDLSRRALEALALAEYKLGHLTTGELRRLLGFGTRAALDVFLKTHGVNVAYTIDDLERERQDLSRLGFQMPGRLVVADAGPLHYLVLIGHGNILPALFDKVFVPAIVREELRHIEAPASVRAGAKNLPSWLEACGFGPRRCIDSAAR